MARLYIDYIHAKYGAGVSGGANYVNACLEEFIKRIKKDEEIHPATIIWPKNYNPKQENEIAFINSGLFEIIYCDKVEDVKFEKDAVLFIPLIGVKELNLLKTLKRKEPTLRLYVTIHGVRFIDAKCDLYDLKYFSSVTEKIKYVLLQMVARPAKLYYYKSILASTLPLCEEVITVSNDSLTKITKYAKVLTIFPQYQRCSFTDYKIKLKQNDDHYMLFVSGNREIKNLARSIIAYKKYISDNPAGLSLFITGVAGKVREALINNLAINDLVVQEKIKFMPYLSDDELAELYFNARFLLYPSKSEGFGLPAMEAACFNCPTVGGYGTAIPEVLGAAAFYVDPYNIDSIVYGIKQMEKSEVNKTYRILLNKMLPLIKSKVDSNYDILYNKLFSK